MSCTVTLNYCVFLRKPCSKFTLYSSMCVSINIYGNILGKFVVNTEIEFLVNEIQLLAI